MAANLFCSHIYPPATKIQQDQECQTLKSCERQANYRLSLTDGRAEPKTGHQEKQGSETGRETRAAFLSILERNNSLVSSGLVSLQVFRFILLKKTKGGQENWNYLMFNWSLKEIHLPKHQQYKKPKPKKQKQKKPNKKN